jgi:HD superfamily phosphohydrolase
MYQQVYLHRIERAAGAMLMKLLQRVRQVGPAALEGVPEAVARLLGAGDEVNRTAFMALTDHALAQALAGWVSAPDPIVRDLAVRLARRQVFKTLALSREAYEDRREALESLCRAHDLAPEYYLWWDNASDSPFRDPLWMERDGETGERVCLVDAAGEISELGQHSSLLRGIRNRPFRIERLCFPEELREPILAQWGPPAS